MFFKYFLQLLLIITYLENQMLSKFSTWTTFTQYRVSTIPFVIGSGGPLGRLCLQPSAKLSVARFKSATIPVGRFTGLEFSAMSLHN